MFSGLVREIGEVLDIKDEKIFIKSSLTPKIGASIAVNGICLSVDSFQSNIFSANISKETQKCVAMENLSNKVHLEEALKIGDRFDGHIVQGHIDSIAILSHINKQKNSIDMYFSYERSIAPLLVPKGSICVDGISLTINEISSDFFRLSIIPHTFTTTLFHTYKPNRRVNIETDIIARTLLHQQHCAKNKNANFINAFIASY